MRLAMEGRGRDSDQDHRPGKPKKLQTRRQLLEAIRQSCLKAAERPDLPLRRRMMYRRIAETIRLKLEKPT